jgi:hypothetical protein
MLPAGVEPAILASERPQTHTLARMVNEIGCMYMCVYVYICVCICLY